MSVQITTSEITCANGMPAFLARPTSAGPHPVYIFMHERYGLVEHTRDLARRCAGDGFFVLAPDFFYRHPDKASLNAGDSRYDMTDPESVDLLKAAHATIAADESADMTRLAVGGYCQTGRHPLIFAAEVPIAAAVVWYGAASKREWLTNPRQPVMLEDAVARISCPVFGSFGSEDHIISVEDVQHFRNVLEKHRKSYDIHVYKGAPHGWLNDTMPGRYRKEQAEAGWEAQQRFLTRVLSPDYRNDVVEWSFDCAFSRDYDFSKNVRME